MRFSLGTARVGVCTSGPGDNCGWPEHNAHGRASGCLKYLLFGSKRIAGRVSPPRGGRGPAQLEPGVGSACGAVGPCAAPAPALQARGVSDPLPYLCRKISLEINTNQPSAMLAPSYACKTVLVSFFFFLNPYAMTVIEKSASNC